MFSIKGKTEMAICIFRSFEKINLVILNRFNKSSLSKKIKVKISKFFNKCSSIFEILMQK